MHINKFTFKTRNNNLFKFKTIIYLNLKKNNKILFSSLKIWI